MRGLLRPFFRVGVLALIMVLSLMTISACGEEDEATTTSDGPFEVECEIGAFALGLVVAAVTRGRAADEIGEFVSSQPGGIVLSTACEQMAASLVAEPAQEFTFELELPSGTAQEQSVFGTELLDPPAESDDPSVLDCVDWESQALFQLCIDGVIGPPNRPLIQP